ncbi:DAK2 domain-containing protein [Ruoffia tabacinasalis]|uniref:DAK2 domain-containing protein n=1 Tax=Ruoffia tabacinasalis TaxID=87458 RepID=UPI003F9E7FC5
MELTMLTAPEFQSMIIAGADRLTENVDLINSLNVFPVPDGDTGTNMNMSFISGVEKLKENTSGHVGEASTALAKGLLMGARGNSGVILSQIFRGFSKAIEDQENVDAESFVKAFAGGVESAYKAVMKPVEGTILTVARESALAGEQAAKNTTDIVEIMRAIVKGASVALEKTTDMLPVLKQVGVVDSGGKGLLCLYEGFLSSLTGEVIISEDHSKKSEAHSHAVFEETNEHPMSMDDITFGYCTEIMVRIGNGPTVEKEFDYDEFRNILNEKGDSLLVVSDDEIAKVHIHTEDPGEIMQLGQEYGELIKIKVDNMREQVRELETANQALSQQQTTAVAPKDYAVIAVAAGEGMTEMLKSIGIDVVLSGGQTMNPSTEDFVKAMETTSAERFILLPNNKNIIMAAEQAAEVIEKPAVVVPTRTVPEAISAIFAFNPEGTIEDNHAAMSGNIEMVSTGQITYAIRDTNLDGVQILKDEFMGIVDGKIILSEPLVENALYNTLDNMINDESEIVTIFIGEGGKEDLVEQVIEQLESTYSEVDFEVIQGDQPVYEYIMSVE